MNRRLPLAFAPKCLKFKSELGELGEFETVLKTRDAVEGLHNISER